METRISLGLRCETLNPLSAYRKRKGGFDEESKNCY